MGFSLLIRAIFYPPEARCALLRERRLFGCDAPRQRCGPAKLRAERSAGKVPQDAVIGLGRSDLIRTVDCEALRNRSDGIGSMIRKRASIAMSSNSQWLRLRWATSSKFSASITSVTHIR